LAANLAFANTQIAQGLYPVFETTQGSSTTLAEEISSFKKV